MTIGARDDNTKALLLSKQREASKDVSMTVPPEPKLSYKGPIYLGNNDWNSDGEILSSAVAASPKAKNGGALAKTATAAGKQGSLNRQHQGGKIARDSQDFKTAEAAQDTRLSSPFLRKEVPGLARDVDTVGRIAHNTAHAFNNIGSGMAQAFDMKDSSVHSNKPVKILTHV